MDQQDAHGGPARARPVRRRSASARHSDRVAAAAKEALDGFQGVANRDRTAAAPMPRSPGVQVLFAPVSDSPGDRRVEEEWGAEEDLEPVDAGHAGGTGHGSVASPVWNPFRQACDPPPVVSDGPSIVHLHTRTSPAEVTVIATVEYQGRRGHGTALGPPSSGMLHTVAEATLAALRMVVATPLPANIERVTQSSVGDAASVSVAVLWTAGDGDQRLVGQRAIGNDPSRAVMQATLDAVGHRLTVSGTARSS